MPRWSVAAQEAPPLPGTFGLPAFTAGLVAERAWVGVGPPLSASGPSAGSCASRSVPTPGPVKVPSTSR